MTEASWYKRKRLGDILLAKGLISQEDLDKAVALQKTDSRSLGAILVDMGVLRHRLVEALAEQRRHVPEISAEEVGAFSTDAAMLIPQALARRFNCIGLHSTGEGDLVVAMENPHDLAALDILSHVTQRMIEPVKAPGEDILNALEMFYGKDPSEFNTDDDDETQTLEEITLEVERDEGGSEEDEAQASRLAESAEETPVVKFVEALFRDAVRKRASDVHIEPEEQRTHVRLRVDGVLQRLLTISRRMYPAVVSRIKILSGLNIAERRLPQDGRCRFRLGRNEVDVRVSTLPTVYGEKVVMRLLDKSNFVMSLDTLGFSDLDRSRFKEALAATYGMVLLCGPTGSGKTTTLYAALSHLNDPSRSIVTVEDPVEYEMAGIGQVPVRADIGLTFARSLRSILRQDPNVIMVGEMRDLETTQIAVRAALTGHLVLSTLHANNAPAVVVRLIEMGIPPYLVAATLNINIAQRLLRRLCEKCKEERAPEEEALRILGSAGWPPASTLYNAVGCEECDYTGYRGRQSVYEVMPITPRVKRMILENASEAELRDAALGEGMRTLRQEALQKALDGMTSLEEILSIPQDAFEDSAEKKAEAVPGHTP